MSEIQSNYPRNSPFTSGNVDVDVDNLKRASKIGQVALVFIAAVTTIFQIFPKILSFDDKPSLLLIISALGLGLLLILAGIAAIGTTMFWFTRAHRAVCALRGITPRVSSKVVGFFSGIPYLLLYGPLFYALEFLVVRSESPDIPTMRWYTLYSNSRITNVFGIFIVTDAVLAVYSFVMESIVKSPSIVNSTTFDWVSNFIFCVAVILGIRIAKNVNRNIEDLVNRARSA